MFAHTSILLNCTMSETACLKHCSCCSSSVGRGVFCCVNTVSLGRFTPAFISPIPWRRHGWHANAATN
eukprot:GABW01003437.1.p2 GENE.GABW01003437.1~~GABW01003437.1.p2  ORF type:complete len:68 (+),score=8.89 GABW01003437.1:208-411(+)